MKSYEQKHQKITLPRTSSCDSTTSLITYPRTSFSSSTEDHHHHHVSATIHHRAFNISGFLRTLLTTIFTTTCAIFPTNDKSLALTTISTPRFRKSTTVTGTLFGHRRGQISLALQQNPKSEPFLLIQLCIKTLSLVKEISNHGLVRLVMESFHDRKNHMHAHTRHHRNVGLLDESNVWSVSCNGKMCGYTKMRECTGMDWYVLNKVGCVSAGAGVIPVVSDGGCAAEAGEMMYMRGRFERVVGSNGDSMALYMLNPDSGGGGGPELGIYFVRV